MLLREFSSEELNSAFRKRPAVFSAILNGNLGLDTLFLISGFLAALVLIPALEQPRGSTWQVRACCCLLRATEYNHYYQIFAHDGVGHWPVSSLYVLIAAAACVAIQHTLRLLCSPDALNLHPGPDA